MENKGRSLAIVCISYNRIIALLSMTNNSKANWEDSRYISNIDICGIMCKVCQLSLNSVDI